MTPREDETYRSTRYGGHPPACTCVACCEARREGKPRYRENKVSGGGLPIWFWVVIGVVVVAVIAGIVMA
ncbi:conserved hypothetical protein [Dehalogenimonas lykanthroporepellens BL-DC-9]|jgi:hypothetical protein|nr:conserved hypothetical protein [Dehalogenimonas lykanthroporepellens BL-DC-9]